MQSQPGDAIHNQCYQEGTNICVCQPPFTPYTFCPPAFENRSVLYRFDLDSFSWSGLAFHPEVRFVLVAPSLFLPDWLSVWNNRHCLTFCLLGKHPTQQQ